jgi:hypothetical protein
MKRIFRIGRFAPAEKSPQGNWIFSVRLDVGHANHATPLFGFVCDQFT